MQWLICVYCLQFLRVVALAVPRWCGNNDSKEDEVKHDERRLTDATPTRYSQRNNPEELHTTLRNCTQP